MPPGEKLEDKEVDEVVKDCMDAEDDDGMIPYARKSSLHLFVAHSTYFFSSIVIYV